MTSNSREITAAELQQRMAVAEVTGDVGRPLIIDVREIHETAVGMLPDAQRLCRATLVTDIARLAAATNQPIVVYCAHGHRSLLAVETLQQAGYANATSLAGGFYRWQSEGMPVARPSSLTSEQLQRYDRHLRLAEVGETGQKKLLAARVAVVGAGGLGSPAALYLAAAGVGTIGIVDNDTVDLSNLQRQLLHTTARIGTAKTASATTALQAINPDVKVVCFNERLDNANATKILQQFDMIIDGSDNFSTHYLVNDVCTKLGKPFIHGGVQRFEGQVALFAPPYRTNPCYRCVYPVAPAAHEAPSCAEAGVLGVLPGIIGTLQATEALKFLLSIGVPTVGKLLRYDALNSTFKTLSFKIDSACTCHSSVA